MLLAVLLYQVMVLPVAIVAAAYLILFRRSEANERLGGGGGSPGRIWLHAASLGEFEAASPLIKAWSAGGNGGGLLLSCTNAIARKRFSERVPDGTRVRLAPIDFWPCVARALRTERPSQLIFLETEIWPAWILAASLQGIPVAVASARISARSFGRYRALRPFLRPFLERIRVIGCRTEEDRLRWIAIGAPVDRCLVWGNTKHEAGPAPDRSPTRASGPFLLVAGSIRRGEEGVLDAVRSLTEAGRDVRLLLAPRHMREIPEWEAACVRRRLPCRRLSTAGIETAGAPGERFADGIRSMEAGIPAVLIVDRIGVLASLYGLADAALIGGTWIPLGGHNLFEPARAGIPVLFGPSIEGVRDVAEALIAHGGGISVATPEAVAQVVALWIDDPSERARIGGAARKAAESIAGARERTLAGLREAGLGAARSRGGRPV